MIRPIRRMLGATMLTVMLAAAGSTLGAAAAVAAGSAPVVIPRGAVQVLGENEARFCGSHFKPHTTLTVHNETTGVTTVLHTDRNGLACTAVPLARSCAPHAIHIVATGIGPGGRTVTTDTIMTAPGDPAMCPAASDLPFTGTTIIIPGTAAGLILIILGTGAVTLSRRRTTVAR